MEVNGPLPSADTCLHEAVRREAWAVASGPPTSYAGLGSHLPRDPFMRKVLLFVLILSLAAAWMVGCGDSKKTLPTQTLTSNFAFVRSGGGATGFAQHILPFNRLSLRHSARGVPNVSNGNDSIVIMKNDGTGETVLANNVAGIGSVQLSLDGKTGVSMEEDDNGYLQVYYADLTNLSNIQPKQLTSSPEDHYAPQLSADRSTVIYYKWMGDIQGSQAFTVKASGGSETQISTPGMEVYFPTFTPDGKHVVFEGYTNSSSSSTISMMNLDGSGITTITNLGTDWDEMPSVSPGGKTIVFSRYTSGETGGGEDIFTIGMDKTNLKQLTTDGRNWDPLFVNDKIVFVSWRDGNDLIYSMNPDGSNQKNLTPNDTYDFMFWD